MPQACLHTVSALWSAGAGVDNAFICYLLDSDSALGEPDNVLGERDTCLIACYRVNGQKSSHALQDTAALAWFMCVG